eukprot:5681371-Prorocentrum_lima.AAC.1
MYRDWRTLVYQSIATQSNYVDTCFDWYWRHEAQGMTLELLQDEQDGRIQNLDHAVSAAILA